MDLLSAIKADLFQIQSNQNLLISLSTMVYRIYIINLYTIDRTQTHETIDKFHLHV